jgi:transposase-like protein
MGKIRRKFDIQFKNEVVQAIQSGTFSLNQVCQEHQLSRATVERWLEKAAQGTLTAKPSLREKSLEKEIEKLKAKIGEQVMVIDLLKKFHQELAQKKSADSSVITLRNLAQFQRDAKP